MLVKNNRTNVFTLSGTVRLIPGVNEVDDNEWAAALDGHEVNNSLLEKGEDEDKPALEVMSGGKASKASDTQTEEADDGEDEADGAEADDLTDMTVPEASEVIQETFDRDLLAKWKKADTRAGIASAIDKQLEHIKAGGAAE